MNDFLKGNYNLDKKIEDATENNVDPKAEFKRKALNSIGGSMVFVEREKYIWDGDEDDVKD